MELNQFRDVDLVIDKANDNFIQRQFVSQGDYRGRTITVQVTDNGLIGQVPGLMLNLRWQNQASGLADLSAFECIDAENSIFRIEYPEHMMTPGKVIANIQVIQNGHVTHLKSFELTVQNLAGEMTGIVDKAEYGALVAVLADANQFRTDIDTLVMDKADKIALAETDAEVAELDSSKADKTALANTNQQVSGLVSNKVDKGGASQVTWGMIAQDAREQISGDKVAIVGKNSVSSENLVDESVNRVKLDPNLSGFNSNKTELTYDTNQRVTRATEKNGDVVISRTELAYGTDGKLESVTETANGKKIVTNLIYFSDGRISYTQNTLEV